MRNRIRIFFLLVVISLSYFSYGQQRDSLKPKWLQFNLLMGSGVNNSFMGYQRVKAVVIPSSSHCCESEIKQLFSTNEPNSFYPIGEVGLNFQASSTKKLLRHNFYLLSQVYKSQFHFEYNYSYSDVTGKSIFVTREMNYDNISLNLKFGYGLEIPLGNYYITPQLFYSTDLIRKSSISGYTDSSNYFHFNSTTSLISSFHTEDHNILRTTHSHYKSFIVSLEIGRNFEGLISRAYIKTGLASLYVERIYSCGINLNLFQTKSKPVAR